MPEHPIRRSDLRTPAPTLEPDDVFLARLSALAAANAQQGGAAPLATWRVGLAAASVAAVLVGVAWLAGLDPSGSPSPAPTPATTPTTPVETSDSAVSTASRATEPVTTTGPVLGATPATTQADPPVRGGGPGPGAVEPVKPDRGNGNANGQNANGQNANGQSSSTSNGPDEHAGDHPNEHATTKSNNGHHYAGDKSGRGRGGRSER